MPHNNSRKKRIRQDDVRCEMNKALSSSMKTSIKKVLAAIEENDAGQANTLASEAFKRIDKAAKRRVIHPNNASRKKSSIARALKKLQTA